MAPSDSLADSPTLGDLVSVAPPRGLFRGTAFSIRAIASQRELLGLLVRREIKVRYKDSRLGIVWSLVRPIVMFAVYYIAIGKFLGAERSIPDFAIFIFTGLTAWGLYYEIVSSATVSIVVNAGLIKKVYIPREIFPLSVVGSAGFNFLVQFVILVAVTIAFGRAPGANLLFLPLAIVSLVLVSFAIGLLLSALNVYLRDIQHLVEVLLLVLFWSSPIVYSYELVHETLDGGWLEQLYLANPFTPIVLGFQKAMWVAGENQAWPPALELRLAIVAIVGVLAVWAAQRVFARLEGRFAQEL